MLTGKGVWIWEIPNCEGGSLQAIVNKALQHGLTHVLVKIADGRSYHAKNRDRYRQVVQALKAAGLQAWVWQYIYARDAAGEAEFGASLANAVDADGFVIDAEVEYKGKYAAASTYAYTLRRELRHEIPIALSSYYLPDYHQTLPWKEFLAVCDYNMPQIYWHLRDPVWAVRQSCDQNRRYGVAIFPTIGGHTVTQHTPAQMERAIGEIANQGLPGFNVWSWQHMSKGRWQVVGEAQAFSGTRIVDLDSPSHMCIIPCRAQMEGDNLRADVRPLLEYLGWDVHYQHHARTGKVYIQRRKEVSP